MTINARIKLLRKELGYTQIEFWEKLGLKKSASSYLEQKEAPVNPRVAQLICSNFHVNEAWLLHGEGEMFTNEETQLLEQLAKSYNMNAAELALVQHWLEQPESIRNAVVDYALSLSDKIARQRQAEAAAAQSAAKMQQSDSCQANSAATLQQAPHGRVSESDTSPAITSSATQLANRHARPAGISAQEWELVQEIRREKGTSAASDSTAGEKRA